MVVPQVLLDQLATGHEGTLVTHARETWEVDQRAVAAVMATERALDRDPTEMPHNNAGYDIESRDPATGILHFIEVKGRIEGSDTVTVSGRQVIHSQNAPDRFILAIVEVPMDRDTLPVVGYARRPFDGMEVPFGRYSINVPLSEFDLEEPS